MAVLDEVDLHVLAGRALHHGELRRRRSLTGGGAGRGCADNVEVVSDGVIVTGAVLDELHEVE